MRSLAILPLLALALCANTLRSSETLWTENFEAAKQRAAKEGKDLLIDFTGSDWCGWCIKLHQEVFDQAAFKAEAPKHFILVELDYPQKKLQDPEIKKQNEELRGVFGIQGYPTVYLADATGKPYAKTGYQAGGPEKYLESLKTLMAQKAERDSILAAAEKASGPEKAKLLTEALERLEKMGLADAYAPLLKQIVEADPENKSGVTGKAAGQLRVNDAKSLAMQGKFDEALKLIGDHIANDKPTGEDLLLAYKTSARLCMAKRDIEGAIKFLELSIPINTDKNDAEQMAKAVELWKADLAKKKAADEKK